MKQKGKRTMSIKRNITTLGAIILGTGIIACAEKTPPEEIVKNRIIERWEIRKQGKIDGLYEFLSPAKRQVITRPQYERTFGGKIKYLDVTIKAVNCTDASKNGGTDGGDYCQATLYVSYQTLMGDKIKGGTFLNETWVKEKKQWWYSPE